VEDDMTQLEPIKLELDNKSVEAILQAFDKVLLLADQRRGELADANDWQNLAYGLDAFRAFKANLDTLIRAIEDNVAETMPGKKQAVDGLGLLEKRSATSRRWDSEGLLQYMVRDVLDPDRTGEVNYDRMWDLIEALKKALPFTASLGWRVTALKELGMPVDNFCETTYGRQTITIAK
jgi:hypothetical protein